MSHTQTHTARRHVAASRPYDSYYDPVYTTSQNPGAQYRQRSRPAAWNTSTVIPKEQQGSSAHLGNTLPPLAARQQYEDTVPLSSSAAPSSIPDAVETDVLGKSRVKFYKRPAAPYYLNQVPANVKLEQPSADTQNEHDNGALAQLNQESLARTASVGVQTLYRESQAQTEPWSPEYIVDEDDPNPEILELAHLKFNHGLPASMEEIALVQKMREKKAFEASLPPLSEPGGLEKRRRMMEEREMREWREREEEMMAQQEAKLQVLISTLAARDEKVQRMAEARIEKLREKLGNGRHQALEALHKERVKVHRSLGKKRTVQEEDRGAPRDIVAEHADHASKVYAPVMRDGKLPAQNQVVDYGIPLLSHYQGLSSLHQSLPAQATSIKVTAPEKILPKSLASRQGAKFGADLAYVDSLLHKNTQETTHKITNVYKQFEPVVRASTPVVEAPAEEEKHKAALFLQRMIRGRTIQNLQDSGKSHSQHLIAELRLAERPMDGEAKAAQEQAQRQAQAASASLEALQGEVISHALDFIAKEMVRVAEERRIHVLVSEASRIRREREAEESGKRQAEIMKREKEEEHMEHIMDVHQRTADRYLNGLFEVAIDTAAEQQAERLSLIKAQVLDLMIEAIEQECNSAETIVEDLVSAFILPEIERRKANGIEDVTTRRFLDAAHRVTYALVDEVANAADAH